jgi:hypothetical protein
MPKRKALRRLGGIGALLLGGVVFIGFPTLGLIEALAGACVLAQPHNIANWSVVCPGFRGVGLLEWHAAFLSGGRHGKTGLPDRVSPTGP